MESKQYIEFFVCGLRNIANVINNSSICERDPKQGTMGGNFENIIQWSSQLTVQ